MPMQVGNLNKVWEIRALKRKPRHDEAKQMLERIAKQVQPIMHKHNWRVKVLSEFCPKNGRLLGLNVGAGIEVKLRLRRPDRDLEFYPFDEVLDTMLHELCHNAHGPHNATFYQLWDQLRKECEELMAKGITGTGEGFDLPGRRLGGFSRRVPLSSLRKTALAAAENRLKHNTLLPSGPLRLGGDKDIMTSLSPVQAAAMAAERRLQDEIWCASAFADQYAEDDCNSDLSATVLVDTQGGSGSSTSNANAQSSKTNSRKRSYESHDPIGSHRVDGASFVDLTSEKSSASHSISGAQSTKKNKTPLVKPSACTSTEQSTLNCVTTNSGENVMWTCDACTLQNPPLALVCEACETVKPKDMSLKYKLWPCKFCTLENSINMEKCTACDQWRYSRGPPLSSLPPNLGT